MINHLDDRRRGYMSERSQSLEELIEDFLGRPGVSFLETKQIADHLSAEIRKWHNGGGKIVDVEEDVIRHAQVKGG